MSVVIDSVSVDCPAKTNLTLHVGPSHAEWGGRHELDTIYCAVGVYDTVTATRKAPGTGFSLNLEGAYLGDLASSVSDMRRNHAVLALFAMAEASGHEPDVALNINKRIPVSAGMAGGSADAAATILALNALWNLLDPSHPCARGVPSRRVRNQRFGACGYPPCNNAPTRYVARCDTPGVAFCATESCGRRGHGHAEQPDGSNRGTSRGTRLRASRLRGIEGSRRVRPSHARRTGHGRGRPRARLATIPA